MPGGISAVDGLIHVEKVAPGAVVEPAALCDVRNLRSAENEIDTQQIKHLAVGICLPEKRKKLVRHLIPQGFPDDLNLFGIGKLFPVPWHRRKGSELPEHAADHQRDILRLLAETDPQRVAPVERIWVRTAAHILPGCFQRRADLLISPGKSGVIRRFQLLHGADAQFLHHGFGKLFSAALRVRQYRADDPAHHNSLRIQPVRRRGLQQRGHLRSAAALAENGHIFRIPAKGGDILPDPLQRRNDVISAGVSGIFVFLPKIGKVEIAEDIQPVIDGNDHCIAEAAHGRPVIGHLFDGGAGKEAASVEPDKHRSLFPVAPGGPDVQIEAVFIHGPIAVRHIQLAPGRIVGHQRTDVAVAAGIQHSFPGIDRLRRMEPGRLRIGDSLENFKSVLFKSLNRSLPGVDPGRFIVPPE